MGVEGREEEGEEAERRLAAEVGAERTERLQKTAATRVWVKDFIVYIYV